MMWGDKRFYSVDYFYKQKFGSKVMRVSVDGGFTCPNRDGTISSKGCIFCSSRGSGDFCTDREFSIIEQIEDQIKKRLSKWHTSLIIPYFQAFTNTYAPVDRLRIMYEEALSVEGVVGLCIATRADCLSDDVIALLADINKRYFVEVEIGLQSIREDSTRWMNRGYELEVFDSAVHRLKSKGISVVAHVIIGLPGESLFDVHSCMDYLSNLGVDGVKLHGLYLVKDAPMMNEYSSGRLAFISMQDYVVTVTEVISRMNPKMVIHRLTGDPPWRTLVAPKWATDKRNILNQINKRLESEGLYQGKYFKE